MSCPSVPDASRTPNSPEASPRLGRYRLYWRRFEAINRSRCRPMERLVLHYLNGRAGCDRLAFPSQETIAAACQMHPKSIQRLIRELREANVLVVVRRRSGNAYAFTDAFLQNADADASSAEPSSTEPSSTEPSSAEPSSAEPSFAEPSEATPLPDHPSAEGAEPRGRGASAAAARDRQPAPWRGADRGGAATDPSQRSPRTVPVPFPKPFPSFFRPQRFERVERSGGDRGGGRERRSGWSGLGTGELPVGRTDAPPRPSV